MIVLYYKVMGIKKELYIQPPDIIEVDGPIIFIAGPIQGAPLWQNEAASMIHEQKDLIVASPRKNYTKGTFDYDRQVEWETHYLERAAKCGVIMFWLAKQVKETPARAYAQTSRFELGESKIKHQRDGIKLVVGIEPGFGNKRYIIKRFAKDCPKVPILDNLKATVLVALELI